jgi:hypothetical protein
MINDYLKTAIKRFEYYKSLGEKTFDQLNDEQLLWRYNEESNSIATIIKHLSGNMLSRWTDFLTTDGEKEWRNRDSEFENELRTKAQILELWNTGWRCLMHTLQGLSAADLEKTIYIRGEAHSVTDAINRQLAHYPYHIGQIVFIGKMLADNWASLSIPKGQSDAFNETQFGNAAKSRS